MSYATARARVVAVIEALRPTVQGFGLDQGFRHDDKGSAPKLGGPGRRFWMQVLDGGTWAPSPGFSRRTVGLSIIVEYPPLVAQTDDADVILVEDYDVIAKALLNGANWSRATSRIVAINGPGQGRLMPYRITRDPKGARLIISAVVQYDGGGDGAEGTIHYGVAASGAVTTEAHVLALASTFDNVKGHQPFTLTATTSEHYFYVAPVVFGVPVFTLNGFSGGFTLVGEILVDGVMCGIYESNQADLGTLTIGAA